MAASLEIEPAEPQKAPRSLVSALGSAFLEWFLILFLFLDAVISYVITKFARSCKLQTPCLVCSRLDHVLGEEKRDYHWDLMCKRHKLEISSLVHCHAHNKLGDGRKMCETCLLSLMDINKSNAETNRLLVGKLREDFNSDLDHDCLLVEDEKIGSVNRRKCSCCDQPWVLRERARVKELIQKRVVGSEAAESEMPISGSIERDYDHELERSARGRSNSLTVSHSRKVERDPLPHIGYTELKINSDTESEAILSDDEDGSSARTGASLVIHERGDHKDEFLVQSIESKSVVIHEGDEHTEEFLAQSIEPKTDVMSERDGRKEELSVQSIEPQSIVISERDDHKEEFLVKSSEPQSVVILERNDHNEEFSVQSVRPPNVTKSNDLVSDKLLDQATEPKPSHVESPQMKEEETNELVDHKLRESTGAIGHGLEELNWKEVGNEVDSITTPTETLIRASPPSDATETAVEVLENSYVATTGEVGQTTVTKCKEVLERGDPLNATAETSSESNAFANDNGHLVTSSLELGDAYKLAVDNRGKQFSGVLSDQWSGKDSSRVSEDLRVLLSQLSANRGFELPISDVSPKLSVNSDDTKNLDHSSSFSMQILQKRISLERNESGLSMDGSFISEIEGESAMDRLKRQVEHDKKLMAALYKELEEERSASAVATNQAMAMITRLQEEKAALHMEALQYLRMMEEQAEYDDDELQKSNDLLSEKEKEVQDLESELEIYKKKFPNVQYLENVSETSGDIRITDIGVDNSEYIGDNANVSVHPSPVKPCIDDKNVDPGNADSSILDFDDEKTYILQSLKKLEKTLYLLSEDELSTSLSKYDCSENVLSVSGQEENTSSPENLEINGKSHFVKRSSTTDSSQVTDLASLGIMVSGLNDRLEALEADRRFLEHTINSLRNGYEGVQFVQEIASHLQELRKFAMTKDQFVA